MATGVVNKRLLVLSLGYWFSSRTLGLLEHPYITMRAICRDRFMRPLVAVPLVLWGLSWCVGLLLIRVGMWLALGRLVAVLFVAKGLLFVWVWGSVFLLVWQLMLVYLWWRFRKF